MSTEIEIAEEQTDRKAGGWKHFLGIILTLLSALTFSFNALICKLLNHLHPFNLGVWTFQLMTYISIICILFKRLRRSNGPEQNSGFQGVGNLRNFAFLWLRAFLGVSALIFFFYAMKYIELGDALLIDSSSPIFAYIMAYIFLGEKLGLVPIFTTLLAISGIVLIARPPMITGEAEYDMNHLIGSALAFGCMMCITCAIVVIKFLQDIAQEIINLALSVWGTLQCLILAIFLGVLQVPGNFQDIWKIFATASLFFLGQAFLTVALKFENAGTVALLRTVEVFFGFLWQFVFLGVEPDLYSTFGAILILAGVFLTIFRSWIGSLNTDDKRRKLFSIILN